jgi:hypothetical protein
MYEIQCKDRHGRTRGVGVSSTQSAKSCAQAPMSEVTVLQEEVTLPGQALALSTFWIPFNGGFL